MEKKNEQQQGIQVVVFGASGDLAKKKTFPALFRLFNNKFLPDHVKILGYARTKMNKSQFHEKIRTDLEKTKKGKSEIDKFLEVCEYMSGAYDDTKGFEKLKEKLGDNRGRINIYYLALPPNVFVDVTQHIHKFLHSDDSITRLVVEKPFGKDSESSAKITKSLSKLFSESQIFRIDHYLGKEMVKNLLVLRFANLFFSSMWNRQFISSVQILFKENFGVEGRGGYFNEFGIIRDVMQNHMLQMLSVVAMERPTKINSEDVRDEKVKVLRSIPPIELKNLLIGQFGPSEDGKVKGYLDEEDVPKDSTCPTFAMAVMYVCNERWDGVPFIMKAGKGLNEQKIEIRIQFSDVPGLLFQNSDISRNELVIRVQPNEAVYLKMVVKRPGFDSDTIISALDLSYADRYTDMHIPEAYESLILDVLNDDHSNFVRADELQCAWDIFTPVLHQIEKEKTKPVVYPFGSRGPPEADVWLEKLGYKRKEQEYAWPKQSVRSKV